jgi:D-sedoheptulose 7-phosphate isomerase
MTDIATAPVALLAGGLATRLRSVSTAVPKAMVEVAGRPFVDHQLDLLHRHGVRKVVLCVGHLGRMLQDYLGDGSTRGMELQYSFDGATLLGTGGALRRAADLLGDAFFVIYGDSYLNIDYRAVLRHFDRHPASCLMTVIRNENRWDQSNVEFECGQLVKYDKRRPTPQMRYIDYGAALLRRSVLDRIPADAPYDLSDLYASLVSEGRMVGYEVFERFYEIGSPQGLEETRTYLQSLPQERSVSYTSSYIAEATQILSLLDQAKIERMVELLADLRQRRGRLFFLGVGGSAANASHAVNDFRKIAQIESYAPTDNVSELTARVNDDGWDTSFSNWLRGSHLSKNDMVFVLSVGGGNLEKNVSPNIVRALQHAREVGATICGIVGRDGGYTAQVADAAVIVPTVNPESVTPHAEAFQAVVWHLLVSHPTLRATAMKWESTR